MKDYEKDFKEMAQSHTNWHSVPRVYKEAEDRAILCLECTNPDDGDPVFTGTSITNMTGLCHATKERYSATKWTRRKPAPPLTPADLKAFEEKHHVVMPPLLAFYLTNVSSEFVFLEEWVALTDPKPLPHEIDLTNIRDDGMVGPMPAECKEQRAHRPLVVIIGNEGINTCYAIVDGPGSGWALLSTDNPGQYFIAPLWAYVLEPFATQK